MSGALKAVGKKFTKLAKNPLGLAAGALATAALVFTAGSAMGALPSWGDEVSSIFGTDSTLGRVLSSAVTSAGYGALIGGGGAALTGGDLASGLEIGGATGALAGGVTGAIAPAPAAVATPSTSPQDVGPLARHPEMESLVGNAGSGTVQASLNSTAAAPALSGTAAPATRGTGILSGYPGDTSTLLGNLISGTASGIATGMSEADQEKALLARDRATREATAANYGGGKGLLTQKDAAQLPDGSGNPGPVERFDASTYGKGRWAYSPELKRLVFVKSQVA